MKNQLIFGCLALLGLGACSKSELPGKPRYGTWIRNIGVTEELSEHLTKEKHIDLKNNCIQMVAKDTVVEGIYRAEKVLVFSPDSCPPAGQIANRKSFVLRYTEAKSQTDGASIAYDLFKDGVDVGVVVAEAENRLELGQICSGSYFQNNCDLLATPDKRFSDVDTAKYARAQRERHRAIVKEFRDSLAIAEKGITGFQKDATETVLAKLQREGKAINENVKSSFQSAQEHYTKEKTLQSAKMKEYFDRNRQTTIDKAIELKSEVLAKAKALRDEFVFTHTVSTLATNLHFWLQLRLLRQDFAKDMGAALQKETASFSKMLKDERENHFNKFREELKKRADEVGKSLEGVAGRLGTLERNQKASLDKLAEALRGVNRSIDAIGKELPKARRNAMRALEGVPLAVQAIPIDIRDNIGEARIQRLLQAIRGIQAHYSASYQILENLFELDAELSTTPIRDSNNMRDEIRRFQEISRQTISAFGTPRFRDALRDLRTYLRSGTLERNVIDYWLTYAEVRTRLYDAVDGIQELIGDYFVAF